MHLDCGICGERSLPSFERHSFDGDSIALLGFPLGFYRVISGQFG